MLNNAKVDVAQSLKVFMSGIMEINIKHIYHGFLSMYVLTLLVFIVLPLQVYPVLLLQKHLLYRCHFCNHGVTLRDSFTRVAWVCQTQPSAQTKLQQEKKNLISLRDAHRIQAVANKGTSFIPL